MGDKSRDPEDRKKEEVRREWIGKIGALLVSVLVVLLSFLIGWLKPLVGAFAVVGLHICLFWLWTHLPAFREVIDRHKKDGRKDE